MVMVEESPENVNDFRGRRAPDSLELAISGKVLGTVP